MKYNWTDAEIKSLFNKVEECKKNSKPVLDAFYFHAKKYSRKPLSVRNFYYQKIDEIVENKKLQKQLAINIKLHEKDNYAKFDERQTEKLLAFIKQRQKEGKSVRSACMELSNNDATKLVRLQNKFRAEQLKLKKQNDLAKSELSSTSKNVKSNEVFTPLDENANLIANNGTKNSIQNNNQNVISFPVENKLTQTPLNDAEIQSLFLGLVKLIKKTAKHSLEQEFQKERDNFSVIIRDNAIELAGKSEKLGQVLCENEKLSKQVIDLKQKLEQLRAEFSQKLNLEKN